VFAMRSVVAVAAMVMTQTALARQYAPRVVSPHNADCYSLKTFADFHRWRDLTGDQRAWEIYKYLADTRTGLFHMNEVLEGDDDLSEYRTVRDPVKVINVYGYAYCAIFGPVMAGICEGVGLGQARTLVLRDWSHVAAEAFYDGKWHYLDLDLRAVFRRPDGTLASMDDARRDASLWTGRGPLFFPNDPLDSTRKIYENTPVDYYHGFSSSGHTMDYVLRQGETFTRWWTPQGGRWQHPEAYNRVDWLRKLIEQEPRGPAPNHRHFTIYNYANGRFVYEPNLTAESTDFADGAYEAVNVRASAAGLTLTEAGEGHVTFEVRSPYIIVPVVGDLDRRDDDREASVIDIDATAASLSISLDSGLTWRPIDANVGHTTIDLTPHVSGTYGYLLKIALNGKPEEACVRSLHITTWVQVAPAALPSLREGANRMDYRTGDHYGLQTRVVEIRSNASKPEELLKYLVEPPEEYDPSQKTSRIRGPITAKCEAPPGTRIAWFSAGASFRTHQGDAAANTNNRIAYAVNEPTDFREIYRANIPTYCNHWHYNADEEVELEEPARALYVRYVGDPALNNIRIYAHCLEDKPRVSGPVAITHVWTEGGVPNRSRVTLDGPGEYEIVAGGDPVDRSIEIAVPSDGPGRAEAAVPAPAAAGAEPWVEPMKAVHERFTGQKGTFAQFGDSITDSRAFWFGLRYTRNNASPEMERDFQLVNGYMLEDCWDRKGPEFGNQGRMTIRWAHDNVDAWLRDLNPEVAVIMFGTNDLNSLGLQEYETKTREVVQRCLDNGTVAILSTIPPRHGFETKAAEFADAVRRIARELHVPLTDFHAEVLKRRPDDWDGALDKFAGYEGYDVPTLISRDGVHPSNPQPYRGDYSAEALNSNGFSLRNYLVLTMYARVIREVFEP
jgi:hypothetical protein